MKWKLRTWNNDKEILREIKKQMYIVTGPVG